VLMQSSKGTRKPGTTPSIRPHIILFRIRRVEALPPQRGRQKNLLKPAADPL
jgi:hypothetical protein